MSDRVGQQLGNYRLVSLLGTGGFAEVYLGQHLRLNLQAAIKVLHTHLAGQEAEHFRQEAETIATLMHPSIVRILDYDVQEGMPFLVMDYAPGGSLRRRYPRGSVVPLSVIVSSAKQVAAALQYAHEYKFIHRDVKPENMLVGRHEEVLLSDFGLATLAHSSGSLSTHEAIGTLSYMAPEQIEGHPRPASDQYALGVAVYEWLCGSRPFEGSASEVMVQQLTIPPPPLHEKVTTVPLGIEQVVLRVLAKDPKERFASVAAFAAALEDASQHAFSPTARISSEQPAPSSPVAADFATVAVPTLQPALPIETPSELADLALGVPLAATTPVPSIPPSPLEPTHPVRVRRKGIARSTATLLISLAVLVIAGGILGSVSLLAHFGVPGTHSSTTASIVTQGGTWIDDFFYEPDSFIPNASSGAPDTMADQALYLPLFYGDAQGAIHAGAATEIPTLQNGGVSADAKTWTFHLRPHLVWSDGQPYDARDVDFTWKLWLNPRFGAANTLGLNLITSADVSPNLLSITFHLKQAYAPFLSLWVDGINAPLPWHHFGNMAPQTIYNSPDNLNPRVTSGPFMMSESVPGNHYTLMRNPRYYLARQGLPYLDKLVIRIGPDADTVLKDLQAGTITSAWFLDVSRVQDFQRFTDYTLTTNSTTGGFEALRFNFHNVVLATHLEVRTAIAMAIDHKALIASALHGFGEPLCTDQGSALHPGYQPNANCPPFDPATANKLLDENGWVKGSDGVRARSGQRLEFEYSTTSPKSGWRFDVEALMQHNLSAIGIKLDIQNYPLNTFFGPFLQEGKASPPTGAVVDRYDIAEFATNFGYDPDDSSLLSCDQIPPQGGGNNTDFYCNRALDALYQQELATADPGVRQQIFERIHDILLTEFPFIVLFGERDLAIVHKGTHNYQLSPFEGETINVAEWWCDNGKC